MIIWDALSANAWLFILKKIALDINIFMLGGLGGGGSGGGLSLCRFCGGGSGGGLSTLV